MSEDKLIAVFCQVDDFCTTFSPHYEALLISEGKKHRRRSRAMESSEIISLLIFYHQCRFRNFKHFYLHFAQVYLRSYFPTMVSYSRFIQWLPGEAMLLLNFVTNCCLGNPTGIQYIDSTPLVVSHNRRIHQHRTFDGIARRGKTSTGWFFGFKLHLIINHLGEIIAFFITPGNVSDVNSELINKLCQGLWGQVFGDKGYISKKLKEKLKEQGLELITKLRKNMKKQALPLGDKLKLAKRSVIECTMDALKNQAYIEHSRHRSFHGFIMNVLAGIAAFAFEEKKPKPAFDFPFLVELDQKLLMP